jgi:hypothetical protein
MTEPLKLAEPEVYARLLQHPSMQDAPKPPTLKEFQSWDLQRQQDVLGIFASLNPGIWLETQHNRKIIGTRHVIDRKNEYGEVFSHDEIVWGEPLITK